MTLVLPPGVNGTIRVIGFADSPAHARCPAGGEGGDQGRNQE